MRFLLAVAIFGLFGCVNPIDDMLAGGYSETMAAPPDKKLVGIWTGSMSASLLTMQINEDGTGLYCYSLNDSNALGRLKYDGQKLVFQGSTTASIRDVRHDALVIRSDYTFSKDSILRRDSGLVDASPYCAKAMQ